MSTKKKQTPVKPTPAAKPVGRTIDDFKASYDKSYIIPGKIKAALAKLENGWQYEVDFAKLAGVSLTDLGAYRAAFEDFIVPLNRDGGKRVWAGTKGLAQRMREMVR